MEERLIGDLLKVSRSLLEKQRTNLLNQFLNLMIISKSVFNKDQQKQKTGECMKIKTKILITQKIVVGYQKQTTKKQQISASIYSIVHTLFLKFEAEEKNPSAVYDELTYRKMLVNRGKVV